MKKIRNADTQARDRHLTRLCSRSKNNDNGVYYIFKG